MGKHSKPWEQDAHVLGLAWRARRELRACEEMTVQQQDPSRKDERSCSLEEMWRVQLCAEGSDQLGWSPAAGEVQYGIDQANKVMALANSFRDGESSLTWDVHAMLGEIRSSNEEAGRIEDPSLLAEVIGEKTAIEWHIEAANVWVCEIEISSGEGPSGVRFKRAPGVVSYSPSGLEESIATIDLDDFGPNEIFLPLANGYISLSESVQLIRINYFGQVAARVSAADDWVSFTTEGPSNPGLQRWVFILLGIDGKHAIDIANSLHRI
jgi:hypothetical protein